MTAECALLANALIQLAVHGSNHLNAGTTRTPEGGPYKHMSYVCKDEKCDIKKHLRTFKKYEPDHPDADENGYVEYPSIDKKMEEVAIAINISVIEGLSEDCPSAVKVTKRSSFMIFEYKDEGLRQDSFNFNPDGKLVSWLRLYSSGNTAVFNF